MLKSLLLAATLVLGTAASAGTILNDPGGGGNFQVNFFEPIGQSFTAIDSQLLSIGFRFGIINNGFPNDPVKVDLYTGTGTGGTLVASRTLTLPPNPDFSFYDFDFSGTALTIGDVYSAAVSIVGDSPFTGIQPTGDTYSGGVLFSPNAAVVSCDQGNCDLAFRIIGESGPAVPEPATWALLIAGFGLTGSSLRVVRRRRLATA